MELEIVKAVQSMSNKFFDAFFWLITKMGEETFFLFLLMMIYLCYDKFFAIKFSYFYLISVGFNSFIKLCVGRPRPHVASNQILNRLPADGYSFPSGHTQGFVVSATTGMIEINKRSKSNKLKISLLVTFILLSILVMVSRLYWGQHYLSDVMVGLMLGLSIPFALEWLLRILPNKFKSFFTIDKMFAILGILSGILFVVLLSLELALGFSSSKAYKFVAIFLAMTIGYFIDKKWIHYIANQGFVLGLTKFVISIVFVVGLYLLIDWVFVIRGWLYFVIYLFLGLVCTIILPLIYKNIFKKVNHE